MSAYIMKTPKDVVSPKDEKYRIAGRVFESMIGAHFVKTSNVRQRQRFLV